MLNQIRLKLLQSDICKLINQRNHILMELLIFRYLTGMFIIMRKEFIFHTGKF